jgi:hypothetical protein
MDSSIAKLDDNQMKELKKMEEQLGVVNVKMNMNKN